ncbi:MAG: translation elongation factor 4 [Deltaproteobacteria bacterium]|nr:translation elongation factor 4 [Deltaproteobacteria bacterium]
MNQNHIRNFCIIAHIDHGKSTLADRILTLTGAISEREMREQFLDSMDIERERGITIKASAVRLNYKSKDGNEYIFNLIDTPGHVDFSYEVSRALKACEGAILVVDASQGVEAQTVSNLYQAIENDLTIIPVINKIDLPSIDIEMCLRQLEDDIGLDTSGHIKVSAKLGINIDVLLEEIIKKIPPPQGSPDKPLRALIFDSWFDNYKGVIVLIRVFDGTIRKGTKIKLMSNNKTFEVMEVGVMTPHQKFIETLSAGEVGFISANIKDIKDARVGDTITYEDNPADTPLPGFKETKPMVFAGFYPVEAQKYNQLRDAVEKLRLNDASFVFESENSAALGLGFRCGFLGLLHMEVIKERLEREYGLELISTAPNVVYEILTTKGEKIVIDSPSKMPPSQFIKSICEPVILATIHTPSEYIGSILKLCEERRGVQKSIDYLAQNRVAIKYEIPLAEIIFDFYDRLKTVTRGYGSLDYEFVGYKEGELVKVDILLNGDIVDALSIIVHKDFAYRRAKELVHKIRGVIPRHQFEIAVQAAIGSRVIARETIKAFRKDVLAKCYGGDVTRKRKLLEKQKEGKKKMKQVGRIEIPQEAFLAVLSTEELEED